MTVGGTCRSCPNRSRCTTHGDSVDGKIRLYRVWVGMKSRCMNQNSTYYRYYGGRGIRVEWKSYESFKEWALSSGYRDNLFIDRIDNGANYKPANCRWVSVTTSNRNRRSVKLDMSKAEDIRQLRASGVQPKEIAKKYSISPSHVWSVVKRHTWKSETELGE